MDAKVTYLDHSGFAVTIGGHMMIFDYFNDDAPRRELSGGVVTRAELRLHDRISVFVSHGHSDHFNPSIFGWMDSVKPDYFLSSDITEPHPGFRLNPGDVLEQPAMTVRAYGSTDLGCSYLIDYAGLRVFHAGDLNWWHWREESTPKEIAQSEVDFKREMAPIEEEAKREPFDIAFFPLDPRQKVYYDAGANYFALSVKPRVLIPMHTMGRADLIQDYARRAQFRGTDVVAMTERGKQYHYEKKDGETK